MPKIVDVFESENCTRCGGTGKHSWCQRHKDVCFKCSGNGKHLTIKGMAAYKHYKMLRIIPISDIVVGQDIIVGKSRFIVDSVDVRSNTVRSVGCVYILSEHYQAMKVHNQEDINKALEYQNKLTKTGKIMKKY